MQFNAPNVYCMLAEAYESDWIVDGKPKQVFKREAELKEYEKATLDSK